MATDKKNEKPSDERNVQLDAGDVAVRRRERLWQIWIPKDDPPLPRLSLEDATLIPLSNASFFSKLTYTWVTPIMVLGYQRSLQATDLWKLDPCHSAEVLSQTFNDAWKRRRTAAKEWNDMLQKDSFHPPRLRSAWWRIKSIWGLPMDRQFHEWKNGKGRTHASLSGALNDTVGFFFWSGGLFKVCGDCAQLMGPLIVKSIIRFIEDKEKAKAEGTKGPHIGVGIAMAIGLWAVTILASIGTHQFFWRSMVAGTFARTALIKSIYETGMNLTGKSRTTLTNSSLMNHVSTDISRIDHCAQWFHALWTAPIQIILCTVLLVLQLGTPALVGFALFVFLAPIQERMMKRQFRLRKQSVGRTDQRAKTILEALGSMRVVKYFSYEAPFLDRIYKVREEELKGIKSILFLQSLNLALALSVPVLAATVSFVVYTHLVPNFDVAVIFASLNLFQLLRQPMMFLPRGLSAASDAKSAISRLYKVFEAETHTGSAVAIDENQEWAVDLDKATFEWEAPPSPEGGDKTPTTPFHLENITMQIKRGTLVAVVGRVASGKSSLLSGMVGEMRSVSGRVIFGGRVSYCAQSAWIQNATVRENIIFGQLYDSDRYWRIVEQCCLLPDLRLFPDGDLTEIGEKGVNLSGGQKQRINLARAMYFDADIMLLDDPLSAVDAHVGRALFHNVIAEARTQGKTVIFVTHALHFLSHCDYIYTLSNGRIAEQGSFDDLVAAEGELSHLLRDFGGGSAESVSDEGNEETSAPTGPSLSSGKDVTEGTEHDRLQAAGTGKVEGKLMIKEQRKRGRYPKTVSIYQPPSRLLTDPYPVYGMWHKAGHGFVTIPLLFFGILAMQGTQILGTYTLVWWKADHFNKPFAFYQILYTVFGLAQTLSTFFLGVCNDIFCYYVSRNLHNTAVENIFYAPMSLFDTTPMGRIIGIFGKDVDNVDNNLPASLRMLIMTIGIACGSLVIITIIEHYFVIAAIVIAVGYQYFGAFYRTSAREVKRLEGLLRSLMYSHMSESLTGVPVIRSYGEVSRFVKDNAYYIDLENRALLLMITNQRWLSVRLDFCGALLVFSVALFAVFNTSNSSPAQIGLILSYSMMLTQTCGMLTRQTAEVENYLSSVERVAQYGSSDQVPREAPHSIEDTKPSPSWPEKGAVIMKDLKLRYRPGLPNVLHGISLSIRGGEKVGIVGRTGAGKSSITLALLRIVEYTGLISLDGVDISTIGLRDLRKAVSIIPQEPTVFSGTVRSALDPFSVYDDARLWDALRRAHLVDGSSPDTQVDRADDHKRITLETTIASEGSNFSVGERSLLSLARALVRDNKIVILDEATASVDLETDQKIQQTISTEFKDKTLICIAHRLRTILGYDRILVLDGGNIIEFDSPLILYRQNGVFRSMCEESNITEKDVLGQIE